MGMQHQGICAVANSTQVATPCAVTMPCQHRAIGLQNGAWLLLRQVVNQVGCWVHLDACCLLSEDAGWLLYALWPAGRFCKRD